MGLRTAKPSLKMKIMEKTWYLLYVKEKKELKVAASLNARKIESFCPFNKKNAGGLFGNRDCREPLLAGYLFVRANAFELEQVKYLSNVINLVYWKNQPKEVCENTIARLKYFCETCQNITVNTCRVDAGAQEEVKRNIRGNKIEIVLPEIGYRFAGDRLLQDVKLPNVLVKTIERGTIAAVAK